MAVKASVNFRNHLERPWWESYCFILHFNLFRMLILLLSAGWICNSYLELCKTKGSVCFSWPPQKIWLYLASFKLFCADCGFRGKEYCFNVQNLVNLLWVYQNKIFWTFCNILHFFPTETVWEMYLFKPLELKIIRMLWRSHRWAKNIFKIHHLKTLEKFQWT